MSQKVPSLSTSSWVNGVGEKADKILSYFFLSENLQSQLYAGNISSLPQIIQQYGDQQITLASKIEDALNKMLGGYFDSAQTQARVKVIDGDESKLEILVDGIVTQDGVPYNIAKEIKATNSVIETIMDVNNG